MKINVKYNKVKNTFSQGLIAEYNMGPFGLTLLHCGKKEDQKLVTSLFAWLCIEIGRRSRDKQGVQTRLR